MRMEEDPVKAIKSNTEFRLVLGSRTYTGRDIVMEQAPAEATEQGVKAWEFCRLWLEGQEAFVVHTSGSTGKPKPLSVSRKRMQHSAAMTAKALGLKPSMRALVCINTAYIGGLMMLVRSMEHGLEALVTAPSAQPLGATLPEVDFCALVPMQLRAIMEDTTAREQLNRMKAVIIGGAAVDTGLERAIQEVKAPLYGTFGMTETVSHFALRRLNGPGRQEHFQAFEEITLKADERGCLAVKGAVTGDAWVVTNDLVDLPGHNRFRWLGRYDNVVNSGGVKLHPEEIEKKISEMLNDMEVNYSFFTGPLPDERLGQKLVMVMEGTPPPELLEDIRHRLRDSLGRFETPRHIFSTGSFIRTETGKVKRRETLERLKHENHI